ncbi:MAG TPA: hypothetical protein VGO22_07235 [Pseudorhizobium sp.]|jgi:hypothetical protein|nr:hypothetical protein [Pseudorhizobium sp.]
MSSTTQFIAELVRAANEVERLTDLEHARLLVRSVAAIRDMRVKAGIPSARTHTDKIADLQGLIAQIGIAADTSQEVRAALLRRHA